MKKGLEEGELRANQKTVLKLMAKGMTAKENAELLEMSPQEVRRLAKCRRVSAKRASAGIQGELACGEAAHLHHPILDLNDFENGRNSQHARFSPNVSFLASRSITEKV